MRKLIISLAAAGAALAFASPAAAQYYPQQNYGQSYGYNQNYGYGQNYGYNGYGQNNYGQVRALQARLSAVQWQINRVIRYNGGGRTERLREQAQRIQYRLNQASRSGLNPYEANEISTRIARLESQVQYLGGNRYGRNGYGYNGQYGYDRDDRDNDRDRDGDYDGDRPHR
jgi:hypothetical protein